MKRWLALMLTAAFLFGILPTPLSGMVAGAEEYYLVLFDGNGGNITKRSKTVLSGKPYGELPTPVRDGYLFDGWYTKNGEAVSADTIFTATDDVTLRAKWTEEGKTEASSPDGEDSTAQTGESVVPAESSSTESSSTASSSIASSSTASSSAVSSSTVSSSVAKADDKVSSGTGDFGVGAIVVLGAIAVVSVGIGLYFFLPIEIRGVVLTPNLTPAANAYVTLWQDGEQVAEAVTNEVGIYQLYIKRGSYEIRVSYTDPTTGENLTSVQRIEAPVEDIRINLS